MLDYRILAFSPTKMRWWKNSKYPSTIYWFVENLQRKKYDVSIGLDFFSIRAELHRMNSYF